MITVHGPACEKLGFQANTDGWRNYVLQLGAKGDYGYYNRAPTMIKRTGQWGVSQSTAFLEKRK
jgi:hypothetical protein